MNELTHTKNSNGNLIPVVDGEIGSVKTLVVDARELKTALLISGLLKVKIFWCRKFMTPKPVEVEIENQ